MYDVISPNKTESKGSKNRKSCQDLIEYLDKEETLAKSFVNYLDKENEENLERLDHFFNGVNDEVDKYSVVNAIDNNCKGLSRDETRFYSIVFNPSEKEIQHILNLSYERAKEIKAAGLDNSLEEIQDGIARNLFKEYTKECMDLYAQNFGRDNIKNNTDLVWFGRVEKNRYWKDNSYEVRHNKPILDQIAKLEKRTYSSATQHKIDDLRDSLIKESDVRVGGKDIPITSMLPKSGDNYHIHVIVSRKDVTQKVKLSPLAKPRMNNKHKIQGRECTVGFDRNKYTNGIEMKFDNLFGYQRSIAETYENRKIKAKGKQIEIRESDLTSEHGFYLPKQRSLDQDLPDQSNIPHIDVSIFNNREDQIKYIEQSLKACLPYCNSFTDLEQLFKDRSIECIYKRDEKRKNTVYFKIDGIDNTEQVALQDISFYLKYYGLKNYITKEWKEYFYLPKDHDYSQEFSSVSVDVAKLQTPVEQAKYIEEALRYSLPNSKSMLELREHLKEKGISFKIGRDNLKQTMFFNIEGTNCRISLNDISSNLNYFELKQHVTQEWRDYFYVDRSARPDLPSFSLDTLSSHERRIKYLEETIRACAPGSGSVPELLEKLKTSGIDAKVGKDVDNSKTIFLNFSVDKEIQYKLSDISPNLEYHDLRYYMIKEWKNEFYITKEQAAAYGNIALDPNDPTGYVYESLKKNIPYCSSMDDLYTKLKENKIECVEHINANKEQTLFFNIEGDKTHTYQLSDLSPNLTFYDVKSTITQEWKEYFYLPKEQHYDQDPVPVPTPASVDLSTLRSDQEQLKYIEDSLRESLPYCNSMQEVYTRLEEKGIETNLDKDVDNKQTLSFTIAGHEQQYNLADISSNLNYYELKNHVIREWEEYFYLPKEQHYGQDPVPVPTPASVDLSTLTTNQEQIKHIEESLRESLPYCNSMQDLEQHLEERKIEFQLNRDENGNKMLHFNLTGQDEKYSLSDISPNLNYNDLKNRITREWQEYFYLPKEQQYGQDLVPVPTPAPIDLSKLDIDEQKIKYIENSLRESLPYCNSMKDLERLLDERKIKCNLEYDRDGNRVLSFNLTGQNEKYKLSEISPNLNYNELKNNVTRQWREYFYLPKEQHYGHDPVPVPTPAPVDLSSLTTPQDRIKYIEDSLRESIPYSNSMSDLKDFLRKRDIDCVEIRDENTGLKTLAFKIEGHDYGYNLSDISANLNYYELKSHITQEWKEYFYLPKEQHYGQDSVPVPEPAPVDLSTLTTSQAQKTYIENSLRESLPYCNSMQEVYTQMKDKGIDCTIGETLDNKKTIDFKIENTDQPYSLSEISPNLEYNQLKRSVTEEWEKAFFLPKEVLEKSDLAIETFPIQGNLTREEQVDHIRKALQTSVPYCESMEDLNLRLKEKGIDMVQEYQKDTGRTITFSIPGQQQKETITLSNIDDNLDYSTLRKYIGEDNFEYRNGTGYQERSQVRGIAAAGAVQRLTYQAGLKYIHQNVQPYTTAASISVAGLRIWKSDLSSKEKAAAFMKKVIHNYSVRAGFSYAASAGLSNVNPYVKVAAVVGNVIQKGFGLGSTGQERE